MEHFTPVTAAIGGGLIGLSAAILWNFNGRIAGISGIVGGLVTASSKDADWRLAFLIGLVAAPMVYVGVEGIPDLVVAAGPGRLVAAGLLVGLGTRLGGGCTSGHGVCGIARLSRRSIVATGLFMAAGALTVFLSRHLIGG